MKIELGSAELEELLGTCLDLLESGDVAGVSALMAAHPASAGQLARRLSLLADTGLLPVSDAAEHPGEELGPFRLRGRLGAGAMGVVWRAWQEPPGREVALKVVRPESLLFPESRARFRREVELAARLSHPSILPILAVGEDRGLPWFATELVAGESLGELVARVAERFGSPSAVDMAQVAEGVAERAGRTPTPWRAADGTPHRSWTRFALHVARDLARALAHAHSRGVLHRDIKPQNALIGADGRVWLADFGLASAPEEASLTGTRSAVGSLPYMSPETLSGDVPDVRSDVYGLGALLYELMLLRRPFVQVQAAALVAAILSGEPTPPRALDPRMPRDAEAVLLRALARDPRTRYPTADALADDIDALLAGRPTVARPRTAWERVVATARRRPAATAAIGLGAVLVIGGPLTFGLQSRAAARAVRAERDRTVEAERARAAAAEESALVVAAERDRARAAYRSAMDAVERMLSRLGGDLAHVPAMETLRVRIFEDAIRLLERVVEDSGEGLDVDSVLEAADAMRRIGILQQQLGRPEAAAASIGEGRRLVAAVVDRSPDTAAPRAVELEASLALEETQALTVAGRLQTAAEVGTAGLARLEEHAARLAPRTRAFREARLRSVVGAALARQGQEGGIDEMQAAARALDELFRAEPPTWNSLEDTFGGWHDFTSELLRALGDRRLKPEGVQALERAVELASQRVALEATATREHQLASTRINLAGAYLRERELERARAMYDEVLEHVGDLVERNPSTLTFRLEYANAENQLGLIADMRNDPDTATAHYERAVDVLRELCRLAPEDATFRHRLAVGYLNASSPSRVVGDIARAEELVERGLVELERARALAPDVADYRTTLLTFLGAAWLLRRDAGDHEGVARAAERLAGIDVPDPHNRMALHRAAFAYVAAFELARRDPSLDDEERERALAKYAAAACDLTRRSYEAGNRYPNVRALENLRPLHGREEFEALASWFDAQR